MQARDEARGRLLQVFRFVEALYHQRYPVVRSVAEQPWQLWFTKVPLAPTIWLVHRDGEADGDLILRVRRPVLTVRPALPLPLIDWLEPGWTEPTGSLRLKAGAPEEAAAAFATYQLEWSAWVAEHAAYALYEELYDLRARLDREGERVELLVGDGLFELSAGEESVSHPLLLQPVVLQFDPDEAEFQVRLGEGAPELYTALFRSVPGVEGQVLSRLREELESEGYEPLGGPETAGFLRRVAQSLAVGGQYIEDQSALASTTEVDPGAPVIRRAPLLLLRLRTGGFGRALEAIIRDLQEGGPFPPGLARTVGIDLSTGGSTSVGGAEPAAPEAPGALLAPSGEDESILLSKPANPEQLQIARLLARSGAVLVQGPPGTGKTHTIANLLGHLLAEGKRVLVTSHTSKALQVLREKVVEPLQPLCVSVLDESRRELEAAVDGITDRLDGANPELLEREAAALQAERLALLAQLRAARAELLAARQEEYRPIEWTGESLDPSEAARQVALGRAADGWIPGPVVPLAANPLSPQEWFALYRTNSTVSPGDEAELAGALPDPAVLPEPEAFAQAVDGWQALNDGDLGFREELWAPGTGSRPAEAIGALRAQVAEMRGALGGSTSAPAPWRLAVIEAGREGDSRRKAWDDLLALIRQVDQLAAQAEPLRMAWGPVLPANPSPQLRATLAELRAEVAEGNSLSGLRLLFKPAWKEALAAVRVSNAQPTTPEQFDALIAELDLQLGRTALRERWERQMVALGAPAPGSDPEPERFLRQFIPQIEGLLGWWEGRWQPFEAELVAEGIRWDELRELVPPIQDRYGDLQRLAELLTDHLPSVLAAEEDRRTLVALRRSFHQWEEACSGTSALSNALRTAITERETVTYGEAHARLLALYGLQQEIALRTDLLARLDPVAPALTSAIRLRQGAHGADRPPGEPEAAWRWRILDDELDRRGQQSLVTLQERIATLTAQLQTATADLVERRAWAAQARRTSLEQRLALQGWKQTMRKIGKGTGKRVPALQAEARAKMRLCQSAVPVWIMPLARVAESFDPAQNRFDVVIIDEASQADLLALTALYMGEQLVIVGDDEQVSPEAVGQTAMGAAALIQEHLKGIPNAQNYDALFSVYDLAKSAFEGVQLREHFRSVEPIIQFSNQLSYGGKIKPLRDASGVARRPHTVSIKVDGQSVGKVNEAEAQMVASLLLASCEESAYADATFGVISMVGGEQAERIGQILQREMSPQEFFRRRILCGTAAQLQGDERDVVFLSLVHGPGPNGPLRLLSEGKERSTQKRYNVAASRARDQLWVVHSLNPETDLKPGDLRRRLIVHAANPALPEREGGGANSALVSAVGARLVATGYKVLPAYPVGAYQIDLVVEGGGKRLAVECDGDRYESAGSLAADAERQAILERLGWRFVRVRGSQFYREPEAALAALFARLKETGILPEGAVAGGGDPSGAALLGRITARAAEIRSKWGAPAVVSAAEADAEE